MVLFIKRHYYLFLSWRPYPGRLTIVTRYQIIFTYNYPFIQLGFYWSNLGKVPCSRVQQQCPPLGIEPTTLRCTYLSQGSLCLNQNIGGIYRFLTAWQLLVIVYIQIHDLFLHDVMVFYILWHHFYFYLWICINSN